MSLRACERIGTSATQGRSASPSRPASVGEAARAAIGSLLHAQKCQGSLQEVRGVCESAKRAIFRFMGFSEAGRRGRMVYGAKKTGLKPSQWEGFTMGERPTVPRTFLLSCAISFAEVSSSRNSDLGFRVGTNSRIHESCAAFAPLVCVRTHGHRYNATTLSRVWFRLQRWFRTRVHKSLTAGAGLSELCSSTNKRSRAGEEDATRLTSHRVGTQHAVSNCCQRGPRTVSCRGARGP